MKILSPTLATIPWQDAPPGDPVIWRHNANPIIGRNPHPVLTSVYNSAVISWEGGFRGVFRAEDKAFISHLHTGESPDGVDWAITPEPIAFTNKYPDDPAITRGYDPRVCEIDGTYHVTWCHNAKIGLGTTTDFKQFTYEGDAFLPYNRNGVLFPRRINGKYAMLSRPSDNTHTAFGDIYYSESPDRVYWGRHHFVMGAHTTPWENVKIGPGPVPIETSEGWLLFYHGVRGLCNGFVYSMGAVLLDLDEPWKVVARCRNFLLAPEAPYEEVGVTPNVIFPCSALTDGATNRIAIYYGAADSTLCLAYTTLENVVNYIRNNPLKA